MYFTYVLRSQKDQTRYVGFTRNIEERLIKHNRGKVRYTKGKIPWSLIYFEEYMTKMESRKRELFLKSGQGRKYLDQICK